MMKRTWPEAFIRIAGCALVGMAVAQIIGNQGSIVRQPYEPVFEVSTRHLFWVLAGLEFVMAIACLGATSTRVAALLVLWLSTMVGVYRIGLLILGVRGVSAYYDTMSLNLGVSCGALSFLHSSLFTFMWVGSVAIVTFLWKQETESKSGFKAACPNCGQHVHCKDTDAGREISCPACRQMFALRKEPELKMTCIFCNGHIQFPTHSLGKKMKCPHCGMDITLKEISVGSMQMT